MKILYKNSWTKTMQGFPWIEEMHSLIIVHFSFFFTLLTESTFFYLSEQFWYTTYWYIATVIFNNINKHFCTLLPLPVLCHFELWFSFLLNPYFWCFTFHSSSWFNFQHSSLVYRAIKSLQLAFQVYFCQSE